MMKYDLGYRSVHACIFEVNKPKKYVCYVYSVLVVFLSFLSQRPLPSDSRRDRGWLGSCRLSYVSLFFPSFFPSFFLFIDVMYLVQQNADWWKTYFMYHKRSARWGERALLVVWLKTVIKQPPFDHSQTAIFRFQFSKLDLYCWSLELFPVPSLNL